MSQTDNRADVTLMITSPAPWRVARPRRPPLNSARAKPPVLELLDRGDGRASWTGHAVDELLGMHARLIQQSSRSRDIVWIGELLGHLARQSLSDAGARQRVDEQRHVRRTRSPRSPSRHPGMSSSMTIASPIRPNSSRTRSTCSADASAPPLMTLMPSPTIAGVFGITRTTAVPAGSADSSARARDASRDRHDECGAADTSRQVEASTSSITCGLTARRTMSPSPAASAAAVGRTTHRELRRA